MVSVFERDRKLLEYLDGLGIRPGAHLEVLTTNPLEVRVEGREAQVEAGAAAKVWVTTTG